MKILVVSDTHRHSENLYKVIEMEKPLDMIIHCGDIEEPDDYLRGVANCPVCIVSGNNDFFYHYDREMLVPLSGFKGFITHGHNYYISMGVEMLAREAKSRGADFAFFGHTHRPFNDIVNGVRMINPGSLSYPRQEGKQPSYAILNINNGQYDCTIKYLDAR